MWKLLLLLNSFASPALTLSPSSPSTLPLSTHSLAEIKAGRIAIVDGYLPEPIITALLSDAKSLYALNYFEPDALSSYGFKNDFDPAITRQVLRSQFWHDEGLGNASLRRYLGGIIANLRHQLSNQLDRPSLSTGTSNYMVDWPDEKKKHEISYTRYSTLASLPRHTDEHSEELKKLEGWSRPTRRSISWLIYLNDKTWDNGGELRTYPRKFDPTGPISRSPDLDLQVGWLSGPPSDVPVFLSTTPNTHSNHCQLFIYDYEKNSKEFISIPFAADPLLYLAGDGCVQQFMKLQHKGRSLSGRFRKLEPPHTKADAFLHSLADKNKQEEDVVDILPIGGRLVVFDSVVLPHEVLPCFEKERFAISGWFHEDQKHI